MDSREIMLRAIEFRNPPRVPITYLNRDVERSDAAGTGYGPARGFEPAQPGMTEWGYVWHSLDATMGQPEQRPLADLIRLSSYAPPDPRAPGRFDHLPTCVEQNLGKFLRFGMGVSGFNNVTFLRGFEDFLMDLYTDLPLAERMIDMVFDFETDIIHQLREYPAIDCVCFADDWGTQRGLMVAPELWRRVFRPRYARQFALAHEIGKKVWFHCCGNVYDIIGDLIDIGADVVEFLQPDLLGVDRMAAEFGGKVCFCCSIDHQRRAISGTREEIFAYARMLNDKLGSFGGGFIGYIEDYASLGMSEDNYQWVKQAFNNLNGR